MYISFFSHGTEEKEKYELHGSLKIQVQSSKGFCIESKFHNGLRLLWYFSISQSMCPTFLQNAHFMNKLLPVVMNFLWIHFSLMNVNIVLQNSPAKSLGHQILANKTSWHCGGVWQVVLWNNHSPISGEQCEAWFLYTSFTSHHRMENKV